MHVCSVVCVCVYSWRWVSCMFCCSARSKQDRHSYNKLQSGLVSG